MKRIDRETIFDEDTTWSWVTPYLDIRDRLQLWDEQHLWEEVFEALLDRDRRRL